MLNILESALPTREATILSMWSGLHTGEPMTEAEIALEIGLSNGQVNKLKNRALEKLRALDVLREWAGSVPMHMEQDPQGFSVSAMELLPNRGGRGLWRVTSDGWIQCKFCAEWMEPGSHPLHRACYNQHMQERRLQNPESHKAAKRRYRARRAGAPTGEGYTLRELWERQSGGCYLAITDGCLHRHRKTRMGATSADQDQATVEHVVALVDGGADCLTNVKMACRECNSRKEALRRRGI